MSAPLVVKYFLDPAGNLVLVLKQTPPYAHLQHHLREIGGRPSPVRAGDWVMPRTQGGNAYFEDVLARVEGMGFSVQPNKK